MELLKVIKHVLIASLTLLCSCFSKDKVREALISKASLQQDFTILRKTVEEAHPGLYWYSSKVAMNNFFDSTYGLIDHDMTRAEFFKLLLRIISNIRCGHSNVRFPKNAEGLPPFQHLLPFDFFCNKGKVFIMNGYENDAYNGSEIVSINHVGAGKILEKLFPALPADGYNQTYKYDVLNSGAFREGYALFFGQPETFDIDASERGTLKHISFRVKGRKPEELLSLKTVRATNNISVSFKDPLGTAILTLQTLEMNTRAFRDSLSGIFQTVASHGSDHLIIDIRKNGGGADDNVSTLFAFIAQAPFRHLRRAEMNAPTFTYPNHFTNPNVFTHLHGTREPDGKYLMNYRYTGTVVQDPFKKNPFKGSVTVLVSGHTSSAASEFTALARYTKRAVLVGEETGGCYYGATGGNYINLVLPASGLEVRIPTIRIFTCVDEDYSAQPKGRGVLPDYYVPTTIEDVLKAKDVQLAKAFELIQKR